MSSLDYWKFYYRSHKISADNSLFSSFVKQFLEQGSSLLELGCGNGRDATFFAKNHIYTTAIDQVEEEITYLQNELGSEYLSFISGDFTQLQKIRDLKPPYDCIYSRFTLHSVSALEEKQLFSDIPLFLKKNGLLAIETRGYKNSLFQKGDSVGGQEDAFIYNDHYRRFVHFESLLESLKNTLGDCEIIFAAEDKGFAPLNGVDDYFIRILARTQRGGGASLEFSL
ncbi:class I SAM-dependent methyltransferase [Helicobacter monodelphidis]|uniref:class I SAM-dependent methyltransferase n=1 Tax=Helicobacter sp. 15-1451 TaxID=2004995 RepID=UPI00215CD950|nr:class I SAM-dependent methyltransferase [Helicobacter sp. 15-1451]